MSKVLTHMTMSLDGYIAGTDNQVGELFEWYQAGETSVPSPNEDITFGLDEAGAKALRDLTENVGALVAGRVLFDIAGGSTSAWSTRCASASCRCCSARASPTSASWTADTCSSTTRR